MGDRAGQQLGNYRLLHLLGKGGFAEVYLAKHRYLDTQAAIKVLNVQREQGMQSLIQQEARISAGLDHPHISRVLEFGFSSEGVPFLVMPYAPGGSLRQLHPPGSRLSLERIVWYIWQIAEALQFAHDRGVVHRDVKPENLLLSQRNEVLLSDFGIAFIADESHTKTDQELAGTARYMAPEQAKKRAKAASDQYALAAVTYEWITGTPPFTGTSFIEIALKHQTEQPPPLQGKSANIEQSLLLEIEAVIMRALAKDPACRFKHVMEFAQALETICRSSEADHGSIAAFYRGHSNYVDALAWSPDGHLIASAGEEATIQVWTALTGVQERAYLGHSRLVTSLSWSPDGKQIASGSHDATVQIWEVTTGKTILTYRRHRDEINCVAFSPDGKHLATSSADKTVQIWDAATGSQILVYQGHDDGSENSYEIPSLAWSPNGRSIASASGKQIHVWDARTGKLLLDYPGHNQERTVVQAVQWSPDGRKLASAGSDKTVQVWDAATGKTIATFHGDHSFLCLAWSPSGNYIASGDRHGSVTIWSYPRGKLYTHYSNKDSVFALAWSPFPMPYGRYVASGDGEGLISVWRTATD